MFALRAGVSSRCCGGTDERKAGKGRPGEQADLLTSQPASQPANNNKLT